MRFVDRAPDILRDFAVAGMSFDAGAQFDEMEKFAQIPGHEQTATVGHGNGIRRFVDETVRDQCVIHAASSMAALYLSA